MIQRILLITRIACVWTIIVSLPGSIVNHEVVVILGSVPLFYLLDKYEIKNVDYLSIDIEGAELFVLSAFPINKYNVRIVTCENNWENKELRKYFEDNKFKMICRLGPDDVWEKA